jgi:hypothetical protein
MNEHTTHTATDIEALLREAGFTFDIVDGCPSAGCPTCTPVPETEAA